MADREFIEKENRAHDSLQRKGYTCWGRTADFKKVYITKGYHPAKYPSEYEEHYFDNWQQADAALN